MKSILKRSRLFLLMVLGARIELARLLIQSQSTHANRVTLEQLLGDQVTILTFEFQRLVCYQYTIPH